MLPFQEQPPHMQLAGQEPSLWDEEAVMWQTPTTGAKGSDLSPAWLLTNKNVMAGDNKWLITLSATK